MTKLSDLYQIKTIKDFSAVAKLCDEKELELLLADFKACLISLRLIDSISQDDAGGNVEVESFNWSPLPKFPAHLLEGQGEGIVVTVEKE